MSSTRIVLGLTRTDRIANYIPAMDGYRDGADQERYVLHVPTEALRGVTLEQVAEAAFTATNHPFPESLTGLAGLIAVEVADARRVSLRSLSTGDTVEMGDVRAICQPTGWEFSYGV